MAERFRKRPVIIEAMHHDGTSKSADAIREWTNNALLDHWIGGRGNRGMTAFRIETLEGTMTAEPGDWIIKGVQGEFYPCKPDIFEQTYEKVE